MAFKSFLKSEKKKLGQVVNKLKGGLSDAEKENLKNALADKRGQKDSTLYFVPLPEGKECTESDLDIDLNDEDDEDKIFSGQAAFGQMVCCPDCGELDDLEGKSQEDLAKLLYRIANGGVSL